MINLSKKEAREMLLNTRIYAGEDSAYIQNFAFKAGYRWGKEPFREVKNLNKPFLFFEISKNNNYIICCTSDKNKFDNSSKKLIDIEDIYNISIDPIPEELIRHGYNTISSSDGFSDDEDFEW